MAHIRDAAEWARAADHYRGRDSLQSMQRLVEQIAASQYTSGIWGWTSMWDLCIAQLPVHEPMSAPYLRISPLDDGQISFAYLDAAIDSDLWKRIVSQDQAFTRLELFFQQLRWFADYKPT